MTYVEALDFAIANVTDVEVSEKLTALKAQVAKKRTSTKPTKNQLANEAIKDEICSILGEADSHLRASDIVKLMDEKYSLPKVTSMLTQLIDESRVVREKDKKVSYFSLA